MCQACQNVTCCQAIDILSQAHENVDPSLLHTAQNFVLNRLDGIQVRRPCLTGYVI